MALDEGTESQKSPVFKLCFSTPPSKKKNKSAMMPSGVPADKVLGSRCSLVQTEGTALAPSPQETPAVCVFFKCD